MYILRLRQHMPLLFYIQGNEICSPDRTKHLSPLDDIKVGTRELIYLLRSTIIIADKKIIIQRGPRILLTGLVHFPWR